MLISNRTNILPGVDIRCDGEYVVGPGSLHVSGCRYEWAPNLHPDKLQIAALPQQFIDLIVGTKETSYQYRDRFQKHSVETHLPNGIRIVVDVDLSGVRHEK